MRAWPGKGLGASPGRDEPGFDEPIEDAAVPEIADEEPEDATDEDLDSEAVREWLRDAADGLSAWTTKAIAAYPRPLPPLAEHWDASVAGIARQIPYVPRIATKPLELLDGVGAVHVGPRKVGFDGKEIDWERVVEVRTEPAWTCLSANALEADLSRFLTFLPRIPGRAWAVRATCGLLLSLYLAVLPVTEDGQIRLPGGIPGSMWVSQWAATQIVYRRRVTNGTVERRAGTAAVVLQLSIPESTDAIVGMAQAHGVPVVAVPAHETDMATAIARAASWRERVQRFTE